MKKKRKQMRSTQTKQIRGGGQGTPLGFNFTEGNENTVARTGKKIKVGTRWAREKEKPKGKRQKRLFLTKVSAGGPTSRLGG